MFSIIHIIIYLLLTHQCTSHHILVSGTTQSYGLWNQLLHVSKELLSRNNQDRTFTNFITFIIDEDHAHWLNTIIKDEHFNQSSYQIIYTPTVPKLDAITIRDASFTERMKSFGGSIIDNSLTAEPILTTYLSQSNHFKSTNNNQLHLTFNNNLTHIHNDVSSIKFEPVDVCLLCPGHIFANYLCKAFDIPVILRHEAAGAPIAETYKYWNTYLYFNNIFTFDDYPDIIYGSIFKSYFQRVKNIIQQIIAKYVQKLAGTLLLKPNIIKLNKKLLFLNKTLNDNEFNDGIFGVWDNTALIHSLGPPFASVTFQRPRIKSYGFLLYPTPFTNNDNSELIKWINNNTNPIIYISMGSVHLLPENAMQHIYSNLINHSKYNKYRILWALRQNIYDNITNQELQTEYFQIMRWVPQLQVLQHPNVKVFVSHGGGNGVVEGFYSKKPMILYPRAGDQYFNAKRTEELKCGLVITDREELSDLSKHIKELLIDQNKYQKNIENVHRMLLQNGGVKEAADFVENVAEFGVDHLLCTLGHLYPCKHRNIAWYQETMIDIYFVIVMFMAMIMGCIRKCCIRMDNVKSIKYKKQ